MANPKRRFSKARTAKRRAQWKLTLPSINRCPHCHHVKMPHRICPNCGYYKGRQVVKVEAE